ncbi:SDR family NAD(P)-dependent oxidoreductase [Streptomyces liangshanensis]|uniref:SDR family oxidoreductase n=1 Tax=Streptomyces liangshanensis TaxID=2717324 RepID=A0A6G9GZ31_9ACTN|nr:SDR family oxidoreductase [Streptomyces liangshanensis]QIQ03542.1 SDR family oxidoreductase [Streptomyces liangshanensis]
MARLAGKVALVAGATRGIGRSVAELFAAEGATVIGGGTSVPEAGSAENGVAFVRLDVTDEQGWDAVVSRLVERHGKLDILVNSAGGGGYSSIADSTVEDWRRTVDLIQTGTFLGMRRVIPVMRENGGGSIVNISSIWGSAAIPAAAAYQAAKAAVEQMTRNAAVTYVGDGIRVNTVIPGITATPLIENQAQEITDLVVAATPMKRIARPIDIAYGCLYLASDEAAFTTGAALAIDGGYLAQ